MYPRDNIFSIYYNIGKRTPFLVKRCKSGLECSSSEERRMDPNRDRTFLVEKVKPRGKYGKAYGKCFVDGKPNDSYRQGCYPDIKDEEIPCAGCGEWVLLDVPGVDMNEIFPIHHIDYVIEFGKHKGKTIKEIYTEDPKYIYWLMEKDSYFRVDFDQLLNISESTSDRERIIENEINRVFPKVKPDDMIPFGKYKGKTFREIFAIDSSYIDWFLRSNQTLDIDVSAFVSMIRKN